MQILVATLRGAVHQQQRAAAFAALLPSLMLSYQPSTPGFDSQLGSECVMHEYAGTAKEMHEAIFFLLQNLALQLGLGQECQPEGIAIT